MALQIVYRKTASIFPDPQNTRIHPDGQVEEIMASISEFGFLNPVKITPDGQLIAGEGRWLAAGRLDMDEIPCIILSDLSEKQRRAYVIADNRIALNSGWDWSKLEAEISELVNSDFNVDVLGFTEDELTAILSDGGVFPSGQKKPPKKSKAPAAAGGDPPSKGVSRIMHTCPHCGKTFN